ncbi:MAG: biotin/lipoyl-containing protein [Planctomycetota bacterium]
MRLRITVEGTTYDVEVEVLDQGGAGATPSVPAAGPPAATPSAGAPPPPRPAGGPPPGAAAPVGSGSDKEVRSPIAGNVLSVSVKAGDAVAVNDVLMVLEAMKMESNVASPVAGTVKSVEVKAADSVQAGQVLVTFE